MDGIEAEQVKCHQLHDGFADVGKIAYGANVYAWATVDNYLHQIRLKWPIQKLCPLEVNARDEDAVTVVAVLSHLKIDFVNRGECVVNEIGLGNSLRTRDVNRC